MLMKKHMSNSQYSTFMECEARAIAECKGEYHQDDCEAFACGSMVDALVLTPDKRAKVEEEHKAIIFTKKGEPSAVYRNAELYAKRLLEGKAMINGVEMTIPQLLAGPKQVKLTGTIAGCEWIGYADALDTATGAIIDLKTTANDGMQWMEIAGRWTKAPWYEARGYWRQLAVYVALASQTFPDVKEWMPYLVYVTKQDPPNIGVLAGTNWARLNREIVGINERMPRILALKTETEQPLACGQCEYCRPRNIPVMREMESFT